MEQILDLLLHTEDFILNLVSYNEPLTYIVLFCIIFSETGLVIFPFFPGDALLLTVGVIAVTGALNIWVLIPVLIAAAILGNTSNYFIGKFAGKRIIKFNNKLFQKYLKNTEDFYEKHGGKAVMYSRFFPIFRTYVPFVAGITRMNFWDFMKFNILGGTIWVFLFTWGGYMVSEIPIIKENFETIFLFIMLLTVVPFLLKGVKALFGKKDVEGSV
ncbi:MAG: membrane-associated protein [Saprospiraceae bacterium]